MSSLPGNLAKVATLFLFGGYLSLTVAFVLGLMALRSADSKFERLNRQWLRLGFLLLACGLVTHAIWAEGAWSDSMAWDRTATWTLLVWLVYGAVLHMHYTPALKGRGVLWASVLAWGFTVSMYFFLGLFFT